VLFTVIAPVTLNALPTYNDFAIPIPPELIKEPVLIEDESVVEFSVIPDVPVRVNELAKFAAPVRPSPPFITKLPVLLLDEVVVLLIVFIPDDCI
jgi:hypothetical protein